MLRLRTILPLSLLTTAALTLSVVGCDDPSTAAPEPTDDAAVDSAVASDVATEDLGPIGDATAGDATPTPPDTTTEPSGPPPLPEVCDFEGFHADAASFETTYINPDPRYVSATLSPAGEAPQDRLVLSFNQIWDLAGAVGPGTYDLAGSTLGTCGNCVSAYTGCTEDACDDMFFLADQGHLIIEEWTEGGSLKARFHNVALREAYYADGMEDNGWVPDGRVWCLADQVVDIPVPASLYPPSGTPKPTCQQGGTGVLLGYNIQNLFLPNCYGENVFLHDRCGLVDALLLMATTGWCGACTYHLQDIADSVGGFISSESLDMMFPGMDMLVILAEDESGGEPTLEFCEAYATTRNLDPANVLIDWSPEEVDIPFVYPAGVKEQFNGMAKTWKAINPYIHYGENELVGAWYPWFGVLDGSNMSYYWTSYAGPGDRGYPLDALLND